MDPPDPEQWNLAIVITKYNFSPILRTAVSLMDSQMSTPTGTWAGGKNFSVHKRQFINHIISKHISQFFGLICDLKVCGKYSGETRDIQERARRLWDLQLQACKKGVYKITKERKLDHAAEDEQI
jgi:hypothetical protein